MVKLYLKTTKQSMKMNATYVLRAKSSIRDFKHMGVQSTCEEGVPSVVPFALVDNVPHPRKCKSE